MKFETSEQTKAALEAIITSFPGVDERHRRDILAAIWQRDKSRPRQLKTREVCDLLDVSRQTVQRWVKQGKLRQIRRSDRLVRYDEGEILAIANGEAAITRKEG